MRSRFRPWIILVALLAVVVFGVAIFPASLTLPLLRPADGSLQYGSAEGWWWNGKATGVRWNGLRLADVHWELTGLAGGAWNGSHWGVSGTGPDYDLAAHLELRGGRLHAARAVRGTVPAGWAAPPTAAPLAGLDGRLELDIDRVLLDADGWPREVRGSVDWLGAGLSGLLSGDLGAARIRFEAQDGATLMQLESRGAADVRLTGRGRLDGSGFNGTLLFRASEPNHPLLRRLEAVGNRQPDGSVTLPFGITRNTEAP